MHSTDHHAATRRSHQHTAAGCKLTDAHLFPFPSHTSPNGHEGPKANGGPHASCMSHEHVDPVSQVRPPRGNRATERPSRVHEPRTTGRPPPRKPSSVRRGPKETRRTEAPQSSARNMEAVPLPRPLSARPEIWSARSSRPHARIAPGSPLWSHCTGRNVAPVLGWSFFLSQTRLL